MQNREHLKEYFLQAVAVRRRRAGGRCASGQARAREEAPRSSRGDLRQVASPNAGTLGKPGFRIFRWDFRTSGAETLHKYGSARPEIYYLIKKSNPPSTFPAAEHTIPTMLELCVLQLEKFWANDVLKM